MQVNPERERSQKVYIMTVIFLFLLFWIPALTSAQSTYSHADRLPLESLLKNTIPDNKPDYTLWNKTEDITLTSSAPDSLLLKKGDSWYQQGETDSATLYFNILYHRYTEQKRIGSVDSLLKGICMGAADVIPGMHFLYLDSFFRDNRLPVGE